jgi:hypothetical protein
MLQHSPRITLHAQHSLADQQDVGARRRQIRQWNQRIIDLSTTATSDFHVPTFFTAEECSHQLTTDELGQRMLCLVKLLTQHNTHSLSLAVCVCVCVCVCDD